MKSYLLILALCCAPLLLSQAEEAQGSKVWKDATVYPLQSKFINWAYYEPLTQTLTLGIGHSAVEYYQVPRSLFVELVSSRQGGSVYHGKIRTRFKHRNVKVIPVKTKGL